MTTDTFHLSRTHKPTGTRVVALITVRKYAKPYFGISGEVLTETVVAAGPEGTKLGQSDVHNTVRFERSEGLDDQYHPARWKAGSYGHFATIADMAERIGGEVAEGTLMRVLHPEAFAK